MKQTAVEKLELKLLGIISFDSEELRERYKDIIKQAKEMEKEQSESICVNVIERMLDKLENAEEINSKEIFEKYYTETFKTK